LEAQVGATLECSDRALALLVFAALFALVNKNLACRAPVAQREARTGVPQGYLKAYDSISAARGGVGTSQRKLATRAGL
jgi:hypothetical protein